MSLWQPGSGFTENKRFVRAASGGEGLAELAERDGVNLEGQLTWAFELEGKPYFEGFPTLASNGLDKAVLNFFHMAGQLGGTQVGLTSSVRAWSARRAS